MVFDGEETHYIERVPESKPSLSSPHFLLSHKHLVPRNLTCGYNGHRHPSLELFKDDNFARMLRYKRSTGNRLEDGPASDGGGRIRGPYNSNVLSRYVELVLVADHLEYKNHGEDVQKIHKRFKDIANIANALYQPLNIFIALVGVEVWAEEDQVAISQDGDLTLTNFLNYRKVRLIPDHPNDNAQLLTGQVFDSGVVGKALKGPICTYQYSGGVNMDHSASVGLVATTVAHEMGHNFGMEHDTEEDCKCPDSRCIMAPSSGSRSPSHWSSCSHEYLALSFERSMDYCLRNKPRTLFDSPVCGNSFVEPGEQCDCGLPQHCDNPCCDPHTCQLYSNATCATGQCCDLQTCHPKEAGTECRSAHRECDLPEYCRGDSEYCPDDVFQEDGHECQAGKAFCHSGMCRSHEQQCQLLWGPTGQNSHDDCYSLNTQGNNNGNCGYNWANDTYFKCSTGNRKCGMMHCKHYNERLEFGMESVSKVSHRFIQGNEREIIPCRVAQVDLGLDMVDPGLAPDGAKCGYQKMCVNQVCMSVASLRREGCSCNGNGACNNLGHCHCALGFSPPDCLEPGFGGSIDSGPASNPHATNKFVVGLVVFFFAVVPLAVASICVVYYIRGNLGVIGLWLTKKGLPGSSRLPTRDPESGRRGGLGIPRGISSTSAGGISSSATSSSESKSNSPLLNGSANITSPHIPVVGANGTSADVKFFGKHQGFTISPIGADSLSEETASRAHTTIVVPNGLSKTSVVPPQPVRQAPSTPAKIVISNPSLQASTNRAVQPVGQVPCLPKTLPPPPSHPSSPPPVAVVNPSRRTHSAAPRPLSVPDQNSVIISRPATAPSANSSKSSSSTASKIASFLNKKDKSAEETNEDDRDANRCSTLPRKASKINRESLMQLEISAPMQLQATKLPENLVPVRVAPEPPSTVIDVTTKDGCKSPKVTWAPSVNSSEKTSAHSSDIHRIGSMREPPVTLRPSIPKFGSMRTPRPKSLPPARPSDPPPRPPLPTIPSPGSEDVYDDCVESFNNTTHITSLGEGTTSPTESIYATIEEGTSPENVTSVESKTVDSDPPSEPEPFYANSSAIIPANDQPAKKSVFSFLYGKTKRKKKESVEEPLYSNIGSIDEVNTSKDASSPPSRSSSLTPPDRASCGSSEDGGLLSEIVSELVTREPDFRNALVSRKKSKTVDDKCGAFIQDKNTQKFEKEVAGTPPAQESKTTVPARVSSARRTSDTKPSITPKPRT
ncbi:hypothetical protein HAZT_HAZT000418 [Hyalella azteca]|uniref:Peptidase M12B domain-containing protein n=1 Tax=Hyalella azteca TaxID=294128 RepID=A0A6A0HBK7_HYAAZ|nr:hypothetical protein HAZT_HAZT000418 [Hyalella azteca]